MMLSRILSVFTMSLMYVGLRVMARPLIPPHVIPSNGVDIG